MGFSCQNIHRTDEYELLLAILAASAIVQLDGPLTTGALTINYSHARNIAAGVNPRRGHVNRSSFRHW